GRWELRVAAFKREIDELCDKGRLGELIAHHTPQLTDVLVETLTRGLTDAAIRQGLEEWRDGRIRTLADLEPRTDLLAREWLASSAAQSTIAAGLMPWLDAILADLIKDIDAICTAHQIPKGALNLSDLAPDLRDFLEGGRGIAVDTIGLDVVTNVVGVAVGAMIGVLIGTLAHLSLTHPLGWALLLAGSIGAMSFGTAKLKARLKTVEVPLWLRRAALSVNSIESQCNSAAPAIRSAIGKRLDE